MALLGSVQQFAAGADPNEAAAQAGGVVVADAGLSADGAGQWPQPDARPAALDEPAEAPVVQGSAAQQEHAEVAVSDSGLSDGRADSDVDTDVVADADEVADADDAQDEGDEAELSSPQFDAADGDADLAAPSDDSTASADALVATIGRDEMTTPATRQSADSVAQDGPAVLLGQNQMTKRANRTTMRPTARTESRGPHSHGPAAV